MAAQQGVAKLECGKPERRSIRRITVDCPASFISLGGEHEGKLVDLSAAGGRITLSGPISEGASGMLRWVGHECFCTVIWTKDGVCGLAFDEPVPPEIIQRTITVEEVEIGPVANFSNIPLGQKRSRRAGLSGLD